MTELCRSLRMLWRYWLNRIILFLYISFSRTLSLFQKLLEIKFLPTNLPECMTAAGLAQSVERLTAERKVAGWIPGAGPILRVLK